MKTSLLFVTNNLVSYCSIVQSPLKVNIIQDVTLSLFVTAQSFVGLTMKKEGKKYQQKSASQPARAGRVETICNTFTPN